MYLISLATYIFMPGIVKVHVAGILCDLVKAFNCINHMILISKYQ